jgi:hypothetical protein
LVSVAPKRYCPPSVYSANKLRVGVVDPTEHQQVGEAGTTNPPRWPLQRDCNGVLNCAAVTRVRSEEEPARALATPSGAETLLRLQSTGGNQMVGRLLAFQQVVEEVHDALDGWNDEDAAIGALARHR